MGDERLSTDAKKLLLKGLAEYQPKAKKQGLRLPSADAFVRVLEDASPFTVAAPVADRIRPTKPFFAFLRLSEVTPFHLVRLLILTEDILRTFETSLTITPSAYQAMDQYRKAHRDFTVLDLAQALERLGVPPDALLHELFEPTSPMRGWKPDQLRPYLLQHLDLVAGALANEMPERFFVDPKEQIPLLEVFNPIPESLFPLVLKEGLSGRKDAPAFQKLLMGSEALRPALKAALGSRKAKERTEAAKWLGDLGDAGFVDAITAQLEKEKNSKARVAMQRALASLGASMPAEQKPPSDVPEVPFACGPLHLADGGPVDNATLNAIVLTASEQKDARPWPELEQFVSRLAPDDRPRLGEAAFKHWLEPEKTADKRLGLLAIIAACLDGAAIPRLLALMEKWKGRRRKLAGAILEVASRLRAREGSYLLLHSAFRAPHRSVRVMSLKELTRISLEAGLSFEQWLEERIPHEGLIPAADIQDLLTDWFRHALRAGRKWQLAFWRERLLEHPVAGPLCRRMVWQIGEEAFSAENASAQKGNPQIRLAHSLTLPSAAATHWREQPKDGLLDQIPDKVFPLGEREGRKQNLSDVEGLRIEDRVLWQWASTHGYERFQPDDRRWYHVLKKRLQGFLLDAYLKIPKGVGCPEKGQLVRPGGLVFAPHDPDGEIEPFTLDLVPEVLIHECRKDLDELKALAEGSSA